MRWEIDAHAGLQLIAETQIEYHALKVWWNAFTKEGSDEKPSISMTCDWRHPNGMTIPFNTGCK